MQLPELVHRQQEEEEEEGEATSEAIDQACIALEWTDSLLRSLDSIPGFRDTVLTTLVVTPPPPLLKTDGASDSPRPCLLKHPLALKQVELDVRTSTSGEKVVLHRPLQSYQFCGMKHVNIDTERPAVVVHRLPGIVRCVFLHLFFQLPLFVN